MTASGILGTIQLSCRLLRKLAQVGLLRPELKHPKAESSVESSVTISWEIPRDQASGTYRIVYHGDRMNENRDVVAFTGQSSPFTVTA